MYRITGEEASILIVDALHTVGDAGEYLVGDGVDGVAEHGDGQMLAENLDAVALGTVDVGDVNHADIHTDIAHILGALAVDEAVAVAIAEMAVQTVGIAYGDGGYHAVAGEHSLAAVAHRIASRHVAQLQDGGLERRHGVDDGIVARVDAIESQT